MIVVHISVCIALLFVLCFSLSLSLSLSPQSSKPSTAAMLQEIMLKQNQHPQHRAMRGRRRHAPARKRARCVIL